MDPVAHISIALATSVLASPQAPVYVLAAYTTVPDLLFFALEAAGVEHKAKTTSDFKNGLQYQTLGFMPWSHGLTMNMVWAVVAGALAFPLYRDLRTSIIIGLMVFSHWVLDAIAYPNMPLVFEGSRLVELGLSTSGPGFIAGIVLDLGLIVAGIVIYLLV